MDDPVMAKIIVEKYTYEPGVRELKRKLEKIFLKLNMDRSYKTGLMKNIDMTKFRFTPDHLKILKPTGVIMHPLPRREEMHIDIDSDPRAKYWRQERNGMWMRVAILSKIFNVHHKIVHPHLGD